MYLPVSEESGLDKPQLLDIARNGRLRGVVAKCPQMCGKILLRFNLKPVDEIEDFCLSLKLHRSCFPSLIAASLTASAVKFDKNYCLSDESAASAGRNG